MTDRSKTLEVMARAMCAKAHLPADDIMSDGKPFWSVYAGMLEYALQAEGMAVVPRTPTKEMVQEGQAVILAAFTAYSDGELPDEQNIADESEVWFAMLAASPYGKAVVKEEQARLDGLAPSSHGNKDHDQ